LWALCPGETSFPELPDERRRTIDVRNTLG
jgi:hypothetical protein